MLSTFFFTQKFYSFAQCGGYYDYIYKKLSESFVRNFLIYSAQFFGEKYVIEYLTKIFFQKIIINTSKLVNYSNYYYYVYFYNIIVGVLIMFALVNLGLFIL